jgi:hypothetical protein
MVKWSFGGNWVSELNPKYSLVYQSLAGTVVWLSDYVFELELAKLKGGVSNAWGLKGKLDSPEPSGN